MSVRIVNLPDDPVPVTGTMTTIGPIQVQGTVTAVNTIAFPLYVSVNNLRTPFVSGACVAYPSSPSLTFFSLKIASSVGGVNGKVTVELSIKSQITTVPLRAAVGIRLTSAGSAAPSSLLALVTLPTPVGLAIQNANREEGLVPSIKVINGEVPEQHTWDFLSNFVRIDPVDVYIVGVAAIGSSNAAIEVAASVYNNY